MMRDAAITAQDTDEENTLDTIRFEKSHCSIAFLLLLCAPRLAIQMAWAAQWAALGPKLEADHDSSWSVQLIQIIGPITGLIVYPMVGVYSDNCLSKYGRRRPFLLGGAIATTVSWLLMMLIDYVGDALGKGWRDTYAVILYALMGISVNVAQVPSTLIIADFAGDRQVTAYSIGQAYTIIGALFVSGYITIFGPAHGSFNSFLAMLIIILLATILPVCYFVKETPHIPDDPSSKPVKFKDAIFAVYTGVRYLRKVLAVYCICFVLVLFGYSCYNGNKSQYFGLVVNGGSSKGADKCLDCVKPLLNSCVPCNKKQNLYNDGVQFAGGIVDTLHLLLGLVFLPILPYLVRKFGARRVFVYSLLPQVLLVIPFFVRQKTVAAVVIVLISITQNMIFAMAIPVILHVIGYGEANGLGMFAGAFNSANCLGQFLTFIMTTIMVAANVSHALPLLVGGIVTFIAFLVAFFKFQIKMYTL
ncbi:Glycoside-Pentoside-Hexuronide (GPH):Cation Symporter Family [Thraustotheca clavata]|uniref:Glycoside-Pentoside-Hexuronide (GPH):Cation Symporter Family n=1 Tax=Thraustotheca clavata TaxID=74557 RepID=A0A1V9ZX21_9STRA|nr:Glycoside-Pentoside-Hexuronide (GPH):Cation Symporter Family [Thraustotheca clavata]